MSKWRVMITGLVAAAILFMSAPATSASDKYLRLTPFEGENWVVMEGALCNGQALRVYRDETEDGWFKAVLWYEKGQDWPAIVLEFKGPGLVDHAHVGTSSPLTFEELQQMFPGGPCEAIMSLIGI